MRAAAQNTELTQPRIPRRILKTLQVRVYKKPDPDPAAARAGAAGCSAAPGELGAVAALVTVPEAATVTGEGGAKAATGAGGSSGAPELRRPGDVDPSVAAKAAAAEEEDGETCAICLSNFQVGVLGGGGGVVRVCEGEGGVVRVCEGEGAWFV